MGYAHAQKAKTREKLLSIAAKHIRENGIETLAIGDLMKNAGLTVGGFYNHFESRDALIVEAMRLAREAGRSNIAASRKNMAHTLDSFIDAYFDQKHIDNPGEGCALCALVGEGKNAGASVRAELSGSFTEQVDYIAKLIGGKGAKAKATGIMTAIVGAVNLARTIEDRQIAQTILAETRKLIQLASRPIAH